MNTGLLHSTQPYQILRLQSTPLYHVENVISVAKDSYNKYISSLARRCGGWSDIKMSNSVRHFTQEVWYEMEEVSANGEGDRVTTH